MAISKLRNKIIFTMLLGIITACGSDNPFDVTVEEEPAAGDSLVALANGATSVMVGDTVQLGAGNTEYTGSQSLYYSWSFLEFPSGSKSVINGADSIEASFVPDRSGTYKVRLVVAAEGATDSSDTLTINANAGDASLIGTVDSSHVERFGNNRIHVYPGTLSLADINSGAITEQTTADVVQSNAGCTFHFQVSSLSAGDYTLAFTPQSDQADPTFTKVKHITYDGNTMQADIEADNIIRVGPNRQYKTLRQADDAASDGDVIEIDAGTYEGPDNIIKWSQNNLVIRGVGGLAHVTTHSVIEYVSSGAEHENGKGLFILNGQNIRIENIEFSNAHVTDQAGTNGAGIRDGHNMTVCNCYLHHNQNGILGGSGHVLIEHSEFAYNGDNTSFIGGYQPNISSPGQTHNAYFGYGVDELTYRYNYTHNAIIGHLLKSRAARNNILYNRITNDTPEGTGSASYEIDLPNGGLSFVIGNTIQQGDSTDNSTMLSYGAEGYGDGTNELYVVNNTFVNDRGNGGTFISIRSGGTKEVINNIFAGQGNVFNSGGTPSSDNLRRTDKSQILFVNASMTDPNYRLIDGSPAIDNGVEPGMAQGMNLIPTRQYNHTTSHLPRQMQGSTYDIGAFEFMP